MSKALVQKLVVLASTLMIVAHSTTETASFFVVTDRKTFNDARSFCQATYGSDLATVDTAAKNAELNGVGAYIGVNDRAKEGTYKWTDGSLATYTAWGPGEPNNAGNEDCTHTRGDGLWNDCNCGASLPFVCNKAPVVETHSFYVLLKQKKTFSDAQAYCKATYDTDLAKVDNAAKNGELTDIQQAKSQYAYIGLTDTEQEGAFKWMDGAAVGYTAWGPGEPNNANDEGCTHLRADGLWNDICCEQEYPFVCNKKTPIETAHYYVFAHLKMNAVNAQAHCQATYGTDLARVDSKAKNDELAGVPEVKSMAAFIGLNDQAGEGNYVWMDGAKASYLAWGPGEPNNSGNNEDCTHFRSDGLWNDINCAAVYSFVCNKYRVIQTEHFLVMIDMKKNFADAQAYCQATYGSDLAKVDSQAKNDELGAVPEAKAAGAAIGLTDHASEGTYMWMDGASSCFRAFGPGEPNNAGDEDCTQLRGDGLWNDINCGAQVAFVCNRPGAPVGVDVECEGAESAMSSVHVPVFVFAMLAVVLAAVVVIVHLFRARLSGYKKIPHAVVMEEDVACLA